MSSFDNFWNLYDNKKSKDKVERKWHLMTAKDQIACMESLLSYIKSTPDRQYRKHPATYLNQRSWNDKIYSKDEETQLYKTPEDKPLSDHEPTNVPTEEERKDFMVGKIKAAYEGKAILNDIGNVYTNRLEKFFDTPSSIKIRIRQDAKERADRKPKNRFEDLPDINYELEVRNRILRYNMKTWREQKREIYREI